MLGLPKADQVCPARMLATALYFRNAAIRGTTKKTLTENYASLTNKCLSCAPQRQEFACAKVLLDSIETRNFVQATLF